MKVMFPIPRITESFIDGVIESLDWRRYRDVRQPGDGEANADYVSMNSILELKIFEEEGLEKSERQAKIASLYKSYAKIGDVVDINIDSIPSEIRRNLETVVSRPLQTAIKKASKQIKQSSELLHMQGTGVLIAVNNGYSYLNADNFEKLIVKRCLNDSSNIGHVACITIDYHQGDFDAYIFCTVRCHAIRGGPEWGEFEKFQTSFGNAFDEAMTQMMSEQMNLDLWNKSLPPITDIRFERDGVVFLRKAPHVPDSRFEKNEI